jgi:eukaryotic-like serine/threonine-protein kinase
MAPEDPSRKSPRPSANEDGSEPHPPSNRKSERPSMRPGGPESLLGRTISSRYRIEKVIGEGGMGVVYSAEHLHMRKRMAVKILHPEMSRLPEVVARFEREAMAAAHIDHPNVAAATDFGKLEDGSFFLVLEYIEGRSLRELIGQGRLTLPRVLHIMEQIAGALGRANAIGIVHRDLKPENVMLISRDGDPDFVKVLDFGIAKVPVGELSAAEASRGPAQPVLTQLGMVYGTPEYMAPEQALGQPVDSRADLYALGVITYEMLTGVRPFDHESKVTLLGMQVTAPVPPMAKVAPEANVPAEIEAIVVRLLAKEASARFADAKALIEATGNALTSLVTEGKLDASVLDQAFGDSSPIQSSMRGTGRRGSLVSAVPSEEARRSADLEAASPAQTGISSTLRASLAKISLRMWAILGASVGAVLLLTLFVSVLSGTNKSRVAVDPEASVTRLSSEEAGGVKVQGPRSDEKTLGEAESMLAKGDAAGAIKILFALEQSIPNDPRVHRDLERAYARTHDTENMLQEAQRWLSTEPTAANDTGLAEDLRSAVVGKEGVDTALALLSGPMGPAGVDILYEIAFPSHASQAPIVQRTRQALSSQEVRSHASAAALVALDLQHATSCDAKRALLPRAKDAGDARTVTILSGYTATTGCGFLRAKDCWWCLHRDGLLNATLAAISARLSANP